MSERCGIVVIGRNEGARLARTLEAAIANGLPVLYVDSRSSDGSLDRARSLGVDVVELPPDEPLGAGRARNLGAATLVSKLPKIAYIHFVDGDCLMQPGWIEQAVKALDDEQSLTAVCGWRVEEQPRRNIFHRMAHVEWQMGSLGEISDFAGDVVVRVAPFLAVGGYDPRVIAGEDTELSSRMVAAGGRIRRIDAISTVHDIGMSNVVQWWKRGQRCGYGYAQVSTLHRDTDRLFNDQVKRTVLWGAVGPLAGLLVLRRSRWPLALLSLRFLIAGVRAARSIHPPGANLTDRLAWGMACSVGVLPGASGVTSFHITRLRRRRHELIEYK
jgi:GT2 family glycosyltransferase